MNTVAHANTDLPALVEIRDVDFSFGSRPVFEKLNMVIPRGQVTAIMGPSGCGKSTLLNFMGGRLIPRSGDVIVDGIVVNKSRRRQLYALRKRMGMLFQRSALLTDLSVFENVAFPIREHTELPEPLIDDLVLLKLQLVGLRGTRYHMPAELSGGMGRRVALARAIALDPMMVMYDEPFTGLDPISLGVIVKLIRQVNDALGMTSIVVTHDVREGCSIADYIYLIGGGNVIGQGTPEEMQNSDSPQVQQFMNGLPDGPVPYHYPAPDYVSELFGEEPK
ncbi:MAG: ABC transporter ATP-binding protein [Gammaproteobacteria bacterium]|nr:ABC transporter ATP-binding protein [Gammaproteobacteria bacterium]